MELPLEASSRKAQRIAAALARCQAIIANSAYGRPCPQFPRRPRATGADHPAAHPRQERPTAPALADIDALIAGRGRFSSRSPGWSRARGVDAALRALPAIRRAFPGATYLIAGAGGDLARLLALAASLNVAEATHFLGRVDEAHKAARLMCADLFAMPTRREGNSVEGYGLAYVEAAWRGKPALAGRVGGAADAVIDGEYGLLCDGGRRRHMRRVDAAYLRRSVAPAPCAAAAARARSELTW